MDCTFSILMFNYVKGISCIFYALGLEILQRQSFEHWPKGKISLVHFFYKYHLISLMKFSLNNLHEDESD